MLALLPLLGKNSHLMHHVHLFLQKLWVYFLYATGSFWWAKRQLRQSGSIVVLMFHRVLKDEEFKRPQVLPGVVVRQRTFRELAQHVSKHYDAIPIHSAVPGQVGDKLRVAFTFDDGWTDNYAVALPIAIEHNIPMTIFVCPGLIGTSQPFWPERMTSLFAASGGSIKRSEIEEMIEQLKKCSPEDRELAIDQLVHRELLNGNCSDKLAEQPVPETSTLSWDEILEMNKGNISFGSHTQTHQILTTVPLDQVRSEISLSKIELERTLNLPCETFAYPNGNWSPEIRDIVAQEGFKLAFTTQRGAWTPDCDPLAIPRANVYEGNLVWPNGRFSPAMFEYTTFWKVWRATRKARLSVPENETNATASSAKQPATVNVCQD